MGIIFKILSVSICLLCFSFIANGQNQQISDLNLSFPTDIGGLVNCIFQDKEGYIWIGKESGLLRYDGNELKIFRHNATDPKSISNDNIQIIAEDRSGDLLIGTKGGGLNRFHHKTQNFTRYLHNSKNKSSISFNEVLTICPDGKGNFWIGTDGGGLNFFNPLTGKFKNYKMGHNGLKSNSILSIVPDGKGKFWIGTWSSGIYSFNPTSKNFKQLGNGTRYNQLDVYCIKEVRPGILWIGTYLDDLISYDIKNDRFSTVIKNWKLNSFNDIQVTNRGEIYVAAWNGLFYYPNWQAPSTIIKSKMPGFDSFYKLFLDKTQSLWISTRNAGLGKINSFEKQFHVLPSAFPFAKSPVYSIFIPNSSSQAYFRTSGNLIEYELATHKYTVHKAPIEFNTIMIEVKALNSLLCSGTYGLSLFNLSSKRFYKPNYHPNNTTNISQESIRSLYDAGSLGIWAAGAIEVYQLLLDNKTKTWKILKKLVLGNKGGLSKSHYLKSFLHHPNGDFWLGSSGAGIHRSFGGSSNFTSLQHKPDNHKWLSNNFIQCLDVDHRGNVWIGTQSGLNKYDLKRGSISSINKTDGLANDWIFNIAIDSKNRAWVTTGSGLSRISDDLKTIKNYDVADGLPSNEILDRSMATDNKGNLYVGTKEGLFWFHPDSIYDNPHLATPIITDFTINGKKISIASASPLDKNIENTSDISLKSSQNTFSFRFAVLNYFNPKRSKIKYKLKGYDKEWQFADASQLANYSAIPSGTYTFIVSAANEDGIWNPDEKQIKLTISSPLLLSNFAILLYATIGGVLILYLFKLSNSSPVPLPSLITKKRVDPEFIQPSAIEAIPANLQYLHKVIDIIEENISDFDFGVQQLCDKMYQTQRQVNRRTKEYAGITITEFIREIKLKRAAQLLSNKSATVSEVSYKVGFINPKYFSRCFKQQFGVSPGHYSDSKVKSEKISDDVRSSEVLKSPNLKERNIHN